MTDSSKWRQFVAAFAATLGIFGLGNVLAWTSPALPDLEADFIKHQHGPGSLSEEQQSWIGSVAVLGALFACPFAGLAVDRFGRRNTMALISLPFIGGWIAIGFAGRSVGLIIAGRVVTGICGGVFSLAAPIYIAETAEDSIRGAMGNMFQIMLVLGILFTYAIGAYVSWNQLAFISAAVPGLALSCLLCVPESPRFLKIRARGEQAVKAICWLRQGNDKSATEQAVQAELAKLETSLQETSNTAKLQLDSLFTGRILKPIAIVLSLMVFEQISGYNGIIFYIGSIFRASGSQMNSNLCSIIVGVIQVLATVVSGLFVDRAGRRILLLVGQVFMALPLVVLGVYFHLKEDQLVLHVHAMDNLGWLPVVCLVVFISAFSLGIGPLSWTMLGELLAPNIKGVCSAVAVCLVWLCAFVVTKTFANIASSLGIDWCFWIYAICCMLGFVSIYFTVPETKGKSLDEIQELFK